MNTRGTEVDLGPLIAFEPTSAEVGSARIAVLIDAENAQPGQVREVLVHASRYGKATVRRAYGDWSGSRLVAWSEVLVESAIDPIHHVGLVPGKNATDIHMVVQAMDLIHARTVDAFFLVSSDSDFTGLARRIREANMLVYGFGKLTTPRAFVASCDAFFHPAQEKPPMAAVPIAANAPSPVRVTNQQTKLEKKIRAAVAAAKGKDGWSAVATVGETLKKSIPSFRPSDYGSGRAKLSKLLEEQPYLDMVSDKHPKVRVKD